MPTHEYLLWTLAVILYIQGACTHLIMLVMLSNMNAIKPRNALAFFFNAAFWPLSLVIFSGLLSMALIVAEWKKS